MTLATGIPLDDWIVQGSEFAYRGHRIRYWTAGQGEPLLLIHGFPSGSWDWHKLWADLAAQYRVIAIDMIGFAFSAKPRDYRYSLLDQADLMQAVLEHLGVNHYHLLAHDYGDSVAQELLDRDLQGPRYLGSVCFLNGGLFPETHRPVLLQKLLMSPVGALIGRLNSRARVASAFSKIFGAQTQPDEVELDAFWRMIECNRGRRVMHLLIGYIAERRQHRDRWLRAMQGSHVPLRLIDGAIDPVSGAHMAERYRELIPSADVVMLEGIGHYPQVEAPEQVLAHYLAFRKLVVSPAAGSSSAA